MQLCLTRSRRLLIPALAIVIGLMAMIQAVYGQSASGADPCAGVRGLMADEITPYDLGLGGGVLRNGGTVESTLTSADYADFWSFTLARPVNDVGQIQDARVSLRFAAIDPALRLEAALFNGMRLAIDDAGVEGYTPVATGTERTFTFRQSGIFTLVVRRADLAPDNQGSYSLFALYDEGDPLAVPNLRDDSLGSLLPQPPEVIEGREVFTLPGDPGVQVQIHPGAPLGVASYEGTQSLIRYDQQGNNYGITLGDWADNIALLGGDLAASGVRSTGQRRIFYLQNFGFRIDQRDPELLSLIDSSGTRLTLSWDILLGVWIGQDCAGFKLTDGRTFTGQIDPAQDARAITFRGTLDEFTIRLLTPDSSGISRPHAVDLAWRGIAEDSEVRLQGGVLRADLTGERAIELESAQIDLRRVLDEATSTPEANLPLAVTLADRGAALRVDWVNLSRLSLIGDQIEFAFLDTAVRDVAARSAIDLLSVDALDDVIHLVYRGADDDTSGEQRLLLPEAESYIEIITPAGPPPFDATALPGTENYAPRALNNTGGECYPVNTLLEQANCPPNGEVNPANGNLWYAVTDHSAYGGWIDLALTRSYNSADAGVDGPFGFGWTSAYRLDYNVAFDPALDSRPITLEADRAYPVGLDLTWAPRGVVVATTPSGSRHAFVTEANDYDGGSLAALTLPGWTLTRADRRDSWTLRQPDGLTYQYDRAGRLTRYGYPLEGRLIEIAYPRAESLDGPATFAGGDPVIITDAPNQRQLELYYDADHHIVRSILRDLTVTQDGAACDNERACFETIYTYEDGRLTAVDYPGGQRADYRYDEAGRLSYHDDPRAPVARIMRYSHHESGEISAIDLFPALDAEPQPWRQISAPVIDLTAGTRSVAVTDELGNTRSYLYRVETGELKAVGESYTLIEATSPLAGIETEELEDIPIEYEWVEGLLGRVRTRQIVEGVGRNSTAIDYAETPTRDIARIFLGYPDFRADYITLPDGTTVPTAITFADNSAAAFTYDTRGWLETYTDRYGAIYRYTWDDQHRLIALEVDDGDDTTPNNITRYSYNELGLIAAVAQTITGEDAASAHTAAYMYDGIGRLVAVDDPLTGGYAIDYSRIAADETLFHEITIADATGTQTLVRFDARGQLAEVRIGPPGDAPASVRYLRRTEYAYDAIGRLTRERRWLWSPLTPEAEPVALNTTYTYTPVESLPPLLGESDFGPVIRGYAVTITDPLGRSRRVVYDALGRIRETQDEFRRIDRYDYTPRGAPGNGLQIIHREAQDRQVIATAIYDFDLRWQLARVSRDGQTWELLTDGDTTRLRALRAREAGITELTWGVYENGRPGTIEVAQVDLGLASAAPASRPEMAAEYDFRGRATRITDGASAIYRVLYCPVTGGAQQVIYTVSETATCAAPETFTHAITYDAAGRVIQVHDLAGQPGESIIEYAYTPVAQGWVALATFTQGETVSAWRLDYNAAGDLTAWLDESGVERVYIHDTTGQLRRVAVRRSPGSSAVYPEGSFTFNYNAIGQLTSQVDDLGRGTEYVYDELGQLTVARDARTGDATIYGYNAAGNLATVSSPLGSTTTFLYDDEDPDRLTGVILPTGGIRRFEWLDETNQFAYIDPRGARTLYRFDSFGALWQIDGPLDDGTDELRYDNSGRLIAWRGAQQIAGESGVAVENGLAFDLAYTQPETVTISGGEDFPWARTFRFATWGGLLETSLPDQAALTFGYDALGRVASIEAGDQVWALIDDQAAVTVIDPYGGSRRLGYDALNRLVSEQNGETETTYTYGRVGERADLNLTIDGARIYTFSAGDDSGRPLRIIRRDPGQRVTYIYDAEGMLIEIVSEVCLNFTEDGFDPLAPDACVDAGTGGVRRTSERFIYDSLGRPLRYIDAEDGITTFAYDDAGNLVSYQNASGQSFTYSYDALNRLIFLDSPTGIRLALRYDPTQRVDGLCRGRVETSTRYEACAERGGELERYTYDRLGRLTEQRFLSGPGEDETIIEHRYAPSGLLGEWGVQGAAGVSIGRDEALGRVEALNTTATSDQIIYSGLNQIAAISDVAYAYDDQGRLTRLAIGATELIYDYAPDGYTVTDTASGARLRFAIDARGTLTAIDVDPPAGDDLITFTAFLNPDGRTLVVQVARADGELIEVQLNRRGEVQNIAYTVTNLLVDYFSGSAGQLRQLITGPRAFFNGETTGYIALISFDSDGRPVTLRVNERESGDLFYLLTFTYDAIGQREREARQYRDGTQMAILYRYGSVNQLISREVRISRPQAVAQSSLPVIGIAPLIALSAGWWLRRRYRRGAPLAGPIAASLTAGLISLLVVAEISAQTMGAEVYVYRYTYDAAGNMTQAALDLTPGTIDDTPEAICAEYSYDSLNRLTRLSAGESVSRSYAYDARSRLSEIDAQPLIYQGSTETLLAAYAPDGVTFYGQTPRLPGFFQADSADDVTWLFSDGRDNLLASDQEGGTIWLFDPIGRFISLTAPVEGRSPAELCRESADLPAELTGLAPPQILRDDAVWDAAANLYFFDGRAYDPQIGRFLQRDPLGPDAFGNLYNYPARQTLPPIRERPPAYANGLYRLDEALMPARFPAALTAASVQAAYYPASDRPLIEPLGAQLQATTGIVRNGLAELLDFPAWLADTYNLPAPALDVTGALRLNTASAPGQDDALADPLRMTGTVYPTARPIPVIAPPLERLIRLEAALNPVTQPFVTYQPFAWQPELPDLAAATITAPGDLPIGPRAVWDYLPQTLEAPEAAVITLNALTTLEGLPDRPNQYWVERALDLALPSLPDLPPANGENYLATWFTTDIFGIQEELAARRPDLPPVFVPVYEVGE